MTHSRLIAIAPRPFLLPLLVLALLGAPCGGARLQAQGLDAPDLIPMPRQIVRVGAPIAVTGPIRVVAGTDSVARFLVADFQAAMDERDLRFPEIPRRAQGRILPRGWEVNVIRFGSPAATEILRRERITFDSAMIAEGYVLVADTTGARIIARTDAGTFYALQTLKQLFTGAGAGAQFHPAVIRDWPAMRWRGLHDDLSRGPLPTLEFQKRQIRLFAAHKINVYSPYFEHTLAFTSEPLIAPPRGAMTREEVRELVAFAAQYHVMVIPEQQTFGHLHHALKYELYQPLSETPHGHVLAPGQPGSIALMRRLYAEVDSLFPAPFFHLGADETFELGQGQTRERVAAQGIGPVYAQYLRDVSRALQRPGKRFLFWGDIALEQPDLVRSLPKDLIAVPWEYGARRGFDRFLKPFRDAGLETWVAPGVNNWNRVWPNNGTALPNIQGWAREGQAGGATGLLNTTWDDFGDALFNQAWYGVLFGAAASWQAGESSIPRFASAFGLRFHGDTTGAIDAAHRHLDAANAALQETRGADASSYLFFLDPYTDEGVVELQRLRPVLSRVRVHAESAIVLIAAARVQAHLREPDVLQAMELGARRLDWIGAKFQFADEIAQSAARTLDPARKEPVTWKDLADLSGINGKLQDMRDGYVLLRELYERAWLLENRPYWMRAQLARFDVEIQTWVGRINAMDRIRRRHARERRLFAPEEIGIPRALLPLPNAP